MKTPKIKKDMSNYKKNCLTTNRFPDSKYNNLLSPNKSVNKNNNIDLTKMNGSYCNTNGNNNNFNYNNISPSKNKFIK